MVEVRKPFPDYAIPRIWSWMEEFRSSVADDFAPTTLDAFMRDWDARTTEERWAVYRDGELGGLISIQPLNPVVVTSHILFKKDFWGQETTIPAIRKVYEEVFDRGVIKISSAVFNDNHAIKGLAKKIGAKREGILKNQTLRGGKPVHMAALGLLKEEFINATIEPSDHPGANGSKRGVRSAVKHPRSQDIGVVQQEDDGSNGDVRT